MDLANFLGKQFSIVQQAYSGGTLQAYGHQPNWFLLPWDWEAGGGRELWMGILMESWGVPSLQQPPEPAAAVGFEVARAASGMGSAVGPVPRTTSPSLGRSSRRFGFPGLRQAKETGQVLLFCCPCRGALQRTVSFATSWDLVTQLLR